mgnify:CR=1 FL=1
MKNNILTFILLLMFCLFVVFSNSLLYSFAILLEIFVISILNFRKILNILLSVLIGAQISSILCIGSYIPELLFSNITETSSISSLLIAKGFILLIIGMLFSYILINKIKYVKNITFSYKIQIIFLSIILTFNVFMIETPVISFLHTIESYLSYSLIKHSDAEKHYQAELYKKNYIYDEKKLIKNTPNLKGKNIIVFFTEGFSAFEIDKYNKYEKLTPNISQLMNKSIYFENYFNHTAATFRGLRGQLTSSYQQIGGWNSEKNGTGEIGKDDIRKRYKKTLISLPDILKNNGYNTYFITSHSNESNLNVMLKQLQFDKVFGYEEFEEQADLTDQKLLEKVKELLISNKLKEPFFLGIYNVGTHLGQNSPDLKYKIDNEYLNTVYNYDDAIGKFIKSYDNTTFKNSSAIIITSDHAAYPSSLLKNTFNLSIPENNYFINKIPFILYSTNIKHKIINANGKNSIDFAPTILSLLRINKGKNYFLGCSLFEKSCNYMFEYQEAIGNDFYSTINRNFTKLQKNELIQDFYALSENTL